MNNPDERPSSRVAVVRLLTQSLGIGLLLVVIGGLAVAVGHWGMGHDWRIGVLVTLVCAISAALAHGLSAFPEGDEFVLLRMMVGMVVRTLPPFLLALWGLYFSEPPLEKSLVLYIILLYFVGLLADVFLTVSRLKNH